jgi:ribosomal protein L40E
MELTYSCPACGTVGQVSTLETNERAVCRRCGTERPLHSEAIAHSHLGACPCCLTTDLYLQKDFPQALGLMIVIVQFAISTVFWYYEMPIATYAVLLASALIDWALYPRVPDVTICYRCSSQVRGEGSNPDKRFQPFDLAIGERYRQERIRAQQLRSRGA